MSTFDVAIVGGGPAGSSAGAALAARGLRVVVLDKSVGRKPCGGYLPVKVLPRLPIPASDDMLQTPIKAIQLMGRRAGSISVNSHQPLGYVVRREQLDERLLQVAENKGATVLRGCRALGYTRESQGLSIRTEQGILTARYLIGADGVHGRTAVDLGIRPRWPRWQLAFSRVAELRWKDRPKSCLAGRLQLFCLPVLGGLGWVFPLPDGVNVGVAGSSLDLECVRRSFDELLVRVERDYGGYETVWQRGWWLPAGGVPRKVTGERVFLVGDAAGFVDCFCGEGIYYAVSSGQLAAHAIFASFSDWRQAGHHYRRDCQTLLLPTLRRALLLSGILGRQKQRYYQALQLQPELATHLLTLMHDERPYHGLLTPLLAALLKACFVSGEQPDHLQVWGVDRLNFPPVNNK